MSVEEKTINGVDSDTRLIDEMADRLHVLDQAEGFGDEAEAALRDEVPRMIDEAVTHWTEERKAEPGSYEYRRVVTPGDCADCGELTGNPDCEKCGTDLSVERSTFTVIGHDRGSIILSVVNAANVSAAREAVEASQGDAWEWRANIDGDIRNLGLGTSDNVEVEVIA